MLQPPNQSNYSEYFTPAHHELAALLGYKQTPGYASWDKVEETAPVQVINRLADYLESERSTLIDELIAKLPEKLTSVKEKLGTDVELPETEAWTRGCNAAIDQVKKALEEAK